MSDLKLKMPLSAPELKGVPLDPFVVRLFLDELDCLIKSHATVLEQLLKAREKLSIEIEERLKEQLK